MIRNRAGLLLLAGLILGLSYPVVSANTIWPLPERFFSNLHYHGENQIMRGVNIGNALDAPSPGEWNVTIKPEYFAIIHSAGFNTVRLPVRFSAHVQNDPPYKIKEDFLEQVDVAVNSGLQEGLNIILDVHHYNAIMQDPAGQESRFLALWRQLSSHYQSFPATLYFELLNEPNSRMQKETWNTLLEKTIKIIRETNPDRKILVDASEYADIEMLPALKLPDDRNLIATFHFYEPFTFTHQGANWVDGADQWLGETWEGNKEEQDYITHRLDRVADWSKQYDIPIVMGEFGAIILAEKASRIRWTSFVAREAEKRKIGWIHWQFCSDFPLYSCENNSWDEQMLHAVIPDLGV
jgi:endoglucanase